MAQLLPDSVGGMGNLKVGESSGIATTRLLPNFPTCGGSHELDAMALLATSGPQPRGLVPLIQQIYP